MLTIYDLSCVIACLIECMWLFVLCLVVYVLHNANWSFNNRSEVSDILFCLISFLRLQNSHSTRV